MGFFSKDKKNKKDSNNVENNDFENEFENDALNDYESDRENDYDDNSDFYSDNNYESLDYQNDEEYNDNSDSFLDDEFDNNDNFEDLLDDKETPQPNKKQYSSLYGGLEEVIIDNIGQGSEDVKNINITLDDGKKIKFVIADAKVKNIESNFLDGHEIFEKRLTWIDESVPDESIINALETEKDNNFFAALTKIIESDEEYGEELAIVLAETYREVSYKNLLIAYEKEVVSSETDWFFDVDSDMIESYNAFDLDPRDFGRTVEAIENVISGYFDKITSMSRFEGVQPDEMYLYPTETSEERIDKADRSVERYVLGTVIESYYENNNVSVDDLTSEDIQTNANLEDIALANEGFSPEEILETIEFLLEEGYISDVPVNYVEPVVEEEEIEEEIVLEEPEEEPEEEIVLEEEDDIIDEPYPAVMEGGTKYLGGALNQYITQFIETREVSSDDEAFIQYLIEYNSVFEQGVQGVEIAIRDTVNEFEHSFQIYSALATLTGEEVDEDSVSSNLTDAANSLQQERDTLNENRIDILTALMNKIEEYNDNSELYENISESINNKIHAIDEVEKTDYYNLSHGPVEYTEETVPLFYSISKELGLEDM